jgi:hypothetical protein
VRWEGVSKDTAAVTALAEKENADLVLELHIAAVANSVANWDQQRTKVEAGPATLETFLWIGTGIGAWWVPDLQFSTKSDVKMLCKRTKHTDSSIGVLTESACKQLSLRATGASRSTFPVENTDSPSGTEQSPGAFLGFIF